VVVLRDRRHARNVPGQLRTLGSALAAVLALAAPACGRSGEPSADDLADRRARQAVAAAAEAGLPEEVQDVLGTAARAPSASFSATYRAGADRVVVHQRPPRRRVDVVVGGVAREAVVSDGDGEVRCQRPAGRPWTCTPAPAGATEAGSRAGGFGAFSPELVARTVEALEDAAGAFTLEVVERRIAGVEASCLRSAPVDGAGDGGGDAAPAWLCVAPDGVPLLVDRGDGTPELRAVAYRSGASSDDVARPDGGAEDP
jgi:hypothetical protein